MSRRLLVMGAGGGATNNLVRSLRRGDLSLHIAGCHHDRFTLKQSTTDQTYLLPRVDHSAFFPSLNAVLKRERIELVIPNSDADVRVLAERRDEVECRLFLPGVNTIALCQDKYELTALLAARGVSVPSTHAVTSLGEVPAIFEHFSPPAPVWCRLRAGQGGMGAMLVRTPSQAISWMQYWEQLRGISPTSFTLSEYLPGRDFACQALFENGRLVLIKSYERLTHLGAGAHPAGVSSLAALSKTVFAPSVVAVCAAAVRAIDPAASGVFCFDVKEDARGVPCLTEINAGRFGLSTNIFDIPGRHNTASTYVRLAVGDPVDILDAYDVAEGFYMIRDYDTEPAVFHADEVFHGTQEVWEELTLAQP